MAVPKGYSSLDAVAGYLGVTLTPAQSVEGQMLLAIAEQFIDLETKSNGGWLNGPIVGEQYDLYNVGSRLYLRSTPVASVEQIQTETYAVGDTPITWTAGTDYRLVDPVRGLVALSRSYGGYPSYAGWAGPGFSEVNQALGTTVGGYGSYAIVNYTPVQTVPLLAKQVTTEVVAYWLTNAIHPERYGLSGIKTEDQAVNFAKMMSDGCFPGTIDRNILNLQQTIL